MNKIKIIIKFLKYRLISQTKFDIHSPFVYELITKCINDKKKQLNYIEIETLRKELLKNKKTIEIQDFGAGSLVSTSKIRTISEITLNSAKQKKYAQLLYRLIKYFKPQNILELGTSLGISTAYMAKAAPNSQLITIEGSKNISEIAITNFKKLNIDNIQVKTGNFDNILSEVLKENHNFDFIFFDGNHLKKPTLNYFQQCLIHKTTESVFVFDDIHWSLEMEETWAEIKKSEEVSLSIDLFFIGLVFFRKESTKQHFTIRF